MESTATDRMSFDLDGNYVYKPKDLTREARKLVKGIPGARYQSHDLRISSNGVQLVAWYTIGNMFHNATMIL